MKRLSGQCLCGAVQFSVADAFLYAGYCHCSRCRRASGSAGAAIGGLPAAALDVTGGEHLLKRYQRSESSVSCFCGECGSPLYGEKPQSGLIHVRYGALSDSPSLLPQAHMHVASKPEWYDIHDNLPQFDEFPPGAS